MDIFELIHREDESIMSTLNTLGKTPPSDPEGRRLLMEEARARIQALERVEKETLLPELRQAEPRDDLAAVAEKDFSEFMRMLDQLLGSGLDTPHEQHQIEDFTRQFGEFVVWRENELYPRLRERLPRDKAADMAGKAERRLREFWPGGHA